MSEVVPLARPDLGPREEELVLEVLRSGYLSLGPMGERFERDFAAWMGVEDAVMVSSGTAALHLGVRMNGWGHGDEVLTSPFSFVASANCLLYTGARPVFCDIDPVTLNIDPAAAAAAVTDKTRGLLPVHIFGYPAAMEELEALAAKNELGIVEDACEALGAVHADGVKVGARGHLAMFAFYANKQMTTGEGGMINPRDAQTATRLRSERNQGRATDMGWLAHDRLGYNYRLSDVAAAIGVAQVERLDSLLAERGRVAGLYEDALLAAGGSLAGEGDPGGLVVPISGHGAEIRSWFVYTVQLPVDMDRDAVIGELGNRGIQSKSYLPCIHLFEHLRELGYRKGQFPVAEAVSERSLALPFFGSMDGATVAKVVAALGDAMASSGNAPAAR